MANRPPPRSGRAGADDVPADRPWWQRWWVVLLVLPVAVLAILGLLAFFFVFAAVPLPEDVGARPTVVLDAAGNEFGTLNPQAARQDLDLARIPERVRHAVMAAEDRNFYDHGGVSATGVARALFANARAGEVTQGGSTITQQYVKNALTGADRTFVRKAKEASLALKLERRFPKDRILEMYLNTIYWGRGAYGIEAAAQTYYATSASELDLNQAATLAGIIQAPEAYDPADGPEAAAGAERRRGYVLAGMLEEGWIDQATHDEVADQPLPEVTSRQTVEYGEGAYYLDAVRRELEQELGAEQVYTGLTVHTELDVDFQRAAEAALGEALADQPFTGAIVSVDPRNGGVRAVVGGPDFAEQPLNTAVRSARQVGSSFKPFTLAAFVGEGWSPESRFEAPACLAVPDGDGGTAEPCNYDRQDHGIEDLYEATRRSTNTVYLQVQEEVGVQNVIDTASRAGLPTERRTSEGVRTVMASVPTLTLGVASFTPLEMASAYGTLASGGVRTTPHLVTRVEDADGALIYEVELQQDAVMEANDAYIVTDVLRGVIAGGTGTAADIGRPAAGKTGTTNDYTDAWFTGYVPQLATAVWIGNLDNSPIEGELTGGSLPARTWGRYMAAALEKLEVEDFPAPDLSGKEILNERPEPSPSPSPVPSPSPSPGPTPCPTEDGDGGIVDGLVGGEGEACPEPTSSPRPTTSPTATEEPSPTASPTDDGTAPDQEPTTEPTGSEEPSPTESDGGGGEDVSGASADDPEPSPSPTG